MELIKKMSDGGILEFREGCFNKFCIYYNGVNIDGNFILKAVSLFGKLNEDRRLKFNSLIDKIGYMEYKNKESLDEIIKKHEHELKPDYLSIERVSYLMLAIFHAEDNWTNPDTGKPSCFKRNMYLSEVKKVGVLGYDVDIVCYLYRKGQLPGVIENLIHETTDMIEKIKGSQKSLFDF